MHEAALAVKAVKPGKQLQFEGTSTGTAHALPVAY